MSRLTEILSAKLTEVTALRETPRHPESRRAVRRQPIDVVGALRRQTGALRLIAEVKFRSPSAGPLSRVLAPGERALAYAEAGAAMVSVLCDTRFFDGSWDHLTAARNRLDVAGVPVPLLAKEFVVDERQIEEARDRGADAVLLIARIVTPQRLIELATCARREGLEPLIEVVDEHEIEAAVEAQAQVVGVNARDLDTLHMDAARAARVLAAVPRDAVAVHLSGLKTAADVAGLSREGGGREGDRPDAALIGEALMRQDDPRTLLGSMVRAARGEHERGSVDVA